VDAVQTIHQQLPTLPLIRATAYLRSTDWAALEALPVMTILSKPFGRVALLSVLRRCIDGHHYDTGQP
jgi:hypothetical protein